MDKKRAEPVAVNRREALKRIGQCAEYTGTVVAFLSVSQPSWASHNKGHGKDCNTGGGTSNMKIASCIEDDNYGHVSSSSSGSNNASSGSNNASSGSNNASSGSNNSSSGNSSVSNSANSQVDNSAAGPAYQ